MANPFDAAEDELKNGATANPFDIAEKEHKDEPLSFGGVGRAFLRQGGEMLSGAADVVKAVPGMVKDTLTGMIPTASSPFIGGTASDAMAQNTVDKIHQAKALADQGRWSDAARITGEAVPVIGPMIGQASEYGSTHTPFESVGAGLATAGLSAATDALIGKAGGPPPVPKTFMGATPEIRTAISVLKPANAIKAVDEYPQAIARLKAEDPTLGQPTNDFPKQLTDAFNNTLAENRHAYEVHVAPLKQMNMQVPLDKMADAMVNSISPKLKLEDPTGVSALETIADRYRTRSSLSDLENMLQETNAQVRAMNNLNTGEKSQAIRASETKTILDQQAKTFREIFYDALDQFHAPGAVKAIQKDYGRILGMKLDAEQAINAELAKPPAEKPGMLAGVGKAAMAGGATGAIAQGGVEGAVLGGLTGAGGKLVANMFHKAEPGGLATLQQVFKDFKGQAAPYPVPASQTPPGRLALPAPTTKLPGVSSPVPGPQPTGPIPPGMGPSSAYPTNQASLPAPGKPPIVTPPPADTSGSIPTTGPRPGAGLGQQEGNRQLPPMPPSPVAQPGFGVQDMVPIRDPKTGQVTYVSRATLRDLINQGKK